MSTQLVNYALHFLVKQEHTNTLEVQFGEQQPELTDELTMFVEQMHHTYNNKGSKAYGHFATPEALPESGETRQALFADVMESYLNEQQAFYSFSTQAVQMLKNKMEKYDLIETGYLLMSHYEYMGGRYILVALIPVSEHFSVDHSLHIIANKHLDTSKMQLAARIDLFEYQQNEKSNRYISFIRGRAGRKVADFFLEFLGCEEGLDAKQQTQTLLTAVEDFVNVAQLDADEKQQSRKELQSYCKEQKSLGEEVSLKEVANVLGHQHQEQDFYQFCQQQGYEIEEEFPHEQSVINKATKYSGYGNGISVSFERHHFGNDVFYDQTNDSLIIHKVPPNLKDQLLKLLNEESH